MNKMPGESRESGAEAVSLTRYREAVKVIDKSQDELRRQIQNILAENPNLRDEFIAKHKTEFEQVPPSTLTSGSAERRFRMDETHYNKLLETIARQTDATEITLESIEKGFLQALENLKRGDPPKALFTAGGFETYPKK